jgi:hypothetical protein
MFHQKTNDAAQPDVRRLVIGKRGSPGPPGFTRANWGSLDDPEIMRESQRKDNAARET